MAELRLYAIGVDELRSFIGAPESERSRLRDQAHTLLAPAEPAAARPRRLGPIFRRTPGAPVRSPAEPTPADLERLLSGGYVSPERTAASWRLLETLVQANAWGSTRTPLPAAALDELGFALTSAGVSSAVGLRHLLNSATQVNLLPVPGLVVGWRPYRVATTMAQAYRTALDQLRGGDRRDLVAALVGWLDGFPSWADAAGTHRRPPPDLVGFWAT